MGLQEVPSAERVHIGFFGRRNAGKSSLVNAITGQQLSVVSDTKGTTTDAVVKSMELLPLGPVVMMDTPGFDDEGSLGEQRVKAAKRTLDRTDVAVLVTDEAQLGACERELLTLFKEKNIPYLIALTKADLRGEDSPESAEHTVSVSALSGAGIDALKEQIAALGSAVKRDNERLLVRDLLTPGDLVILVIPQDKAAPKGRLILPEQMMIRDILDGDARALSIQDTQLQGTLDVLRAGGVPIRMVITDSQVFGKVAKIVPEDIPLTSFSILMARYKGILEQAVHAVRAIDTLADGDQMLISEGCTHHRQCGDIGTVKLPALLERYTGKKLALTFSSGQGFPEELGAYKLIVHCGGCMLGEKEVGSRMDKAKAQGIPFTNYGTAIAYMRGILPRSLSVFPALAREVNG